MARLMALPPVVLYKRNIRLKFALVLLFLSTSPSSASSALASRRRRHIICGRIVKTEAHCV